LQLEPVVPAIDVQDTNDEPADEPDDEPEDELDDEEKSAGDLEPENSSTEQ
jgi:hypothetical protein